MEYKELDFYEALRQIREGRRVTRLSWSDKRSYCFLKEGLLELHKAGESEDKFHAWIINEADIDGQDWIVLPQSN